jgi:hypothetical protein
MTILISDHLVVRLKSARKVSTEKLEGIARQGTMRLGAGE